MSRSLPLIVMSAILSSALVACQASPAIREVTAPPIDFREIQHFFQVYQSVRYKGPETIHADWDKHYDELVVVELTEIRNFYLVGTLHAERRQEIVIRGTTNLKNAFYDVRMSKHMNRDLGIRLHRGFEAMALALYQDILPRLRKDNELVLFGHSLGGAEAVILSMLLERDGFQVRQVYTSGQPKVTDSVGAQKYHALNVLRITNAHDPMPLLPTRDLSPLDHPYSHIGGELVLLDGPYFAYLDSEFANDALAVSFLRNLIQDDVVDELHEHSIGSYLARIAPKLELAVQVGFLERERYITGPR
jgi:predicted lipase